MDSKANLIEWKELLNDMLQFLLEEEEDATTSREMCSTITGKAIKATGDQQQRQHPQCADLNCEEKCDCLQAARNNSCAAKASAKESAEYMNIVNKIDESRYRLIHKCKQLLRKLEERMASSFSSTSCSSSHRELMEEEENSYLEMSGVGHKNDINLTQPTDKIDSCENFETNLEGIDGESQEKQTDDNEEELNLEENCYDFTTDRCLYDDCVEPKLNNVTSWVPLEDEDASKCPFSGLPAAHLRIKQTPKHGTLFRHEKRLFFDQSKKFYVGLLDRWLLLYNNCNELKPAQCIQIKDIKLDLSLNDQINEKNQFHIITQTDAKICFLSPSFKELNEWIVAIEQNLLVKTESIATNNSLNSTRKLPLPPTPTHTNNDDDEPDSSTLNRTSTDHEDGIYEEPQLLSKQREELLERRQQHDYDTPKSATAVDVCHNLNQHSSTKASPTKIINDALISPPPSSARANKCEPICHSVVPTVATNNSAPSTPPPSTPTSTTPVKSWLFNRFNKSPDGASSSNDQKQARKSSKKLSFQLPTESTAKPPPHMPNQPAAAATEVLSVKPPISPGSKSSNSSGAPTTSITVQSGSPKGSKINMIISQLEANGQLSLLSKSLNDPAKRNTWCLDE